MSGWGQSTIDALQGAGLWPRSAGRFRVKCPSDNLLPALLRGWEVPGAVTGAPRPRIAWLDASVKSGASLTEGLGGRGPGDWLDKRLVWWPQGQPHGRWVGITSSRLSRQWETRSDWILALRAALIEIDPGSNLLLTARGTTTDRFVRRLASHLGLPLLVLQEPRTTSLQRWLTNLVRRAGPKRRGETQAYLSPALKSNGAWEQLPLRDRAVIGSSDLLISLHQRRNSQTDRLVRARLSDPACRHRETRLLLGRKLVPFDLASELTASGATVWRPSRLSLAQVESPPGWISNRVAAATNSSTGDGEPWGAGPTAGGGNAGGHHPELHGLMATRLAAGKSWGFLTHCTRRPHGAWPDQSEEAFLDELIWQPDLFDRSPLAALRRILEQQRILATYRAAGSRVRSVCFTSVPLVELPGIRAFRPHRGRWDFEPFGICIRRRWLAQRGARPVRYGAQRLRAALAESERPFFQVAQSSTTGSTAVIDWRREQEWRHLGDVDLSQLPPDEGFVFVSTNHAADEIAPLSPWPVIVLTS